MENDLRYFLLFPSLCNSKFSFKDEVLENDDSGDEESTSEMSEVRFIPEDRGTLDAMYHAMTVCQTLHPDPNDSVSDGTFLYLS